MERMMRLKDAADRMRATIARNADVALNGVLNVMFTKREAANVLGVVEDYIAQAAKAKQDESLRRWAESERMVIGPPKIGGWVCCGCGMTMDVAHTLHDNGDGTRWAWCAVCVTGFERKKPDPNPQRKEENQTKMYLCKCERCLAVDKLIEAHRTNADGDGLRALNALWCDMNPVNRNADVQ